MSSSGPEEGVGRGRDVEDGVTPADLVSRNVRAHSPSLATAQKGLSLTLGSCRLWACLAIGEAAGWEMMILDSVVRRRMG